MQPSVSGGADRFVTISDPVLTILPGTLHSPLLLGVIGLAFLGTSALFCLALIAFSRRRTLQYLLIMGALSALVVRSIVGLGTIYGVVPMYLHHVVSHTLDFLAAALVLYTVYLTGPTHQTSFPE